MKGYPIHLRVGLLLLIISVCMIGHAQEENSKVYSNSTKYIDIKVQSLTKYNSRIDRQQKRLLNNLRRKEIRFARKLKKSDSAAYAKYNEQPTSFDSISKVDITDSLISLSLIKKKNTAIDSLKKIQAFAANTTSKIQLPGGVPDQTKDLNKLQLELNARNHINELITKRTSFLKTLGSDQTKHSSVLSGIEKQAFYGKARMKVFKEMQEDPSVVEEKALEYLHGTPGFSKYMSNASSANGTQGLSTTDPAQLEKLGYQTKQLVQKNLQDKFGSNLGSVSQKMSGDLKGWQDRQKDLTSNIKQVRKSAGQIKATEKPSFKVNPMRGLPLCKRIEKQYNWQTTRAANGMPALLDMAAMAGFKHTPRLTYGAGIATSIGLGQSWQNIHISFQGAGLRTFATWKWQYGIAAYAGYERMYKQAAFKNEKPPGDWQPTSHDKHKYSETILVGLTKNYSINAKYTGAIQVLYDIWWQQNGLTNPIVLRFVTIKK